MPPDGKVCTFDCIYCECGYNSDHRPKLRRPHREEVSKALEATLIQMTKDGQLPDVLTFAGNGEPTAHPQFAEIIDDTIYLRNRYCHNAKVSVLSNATFANRPAVHDALMRVDNNILKLDTIDPIYINKVDRPVSSIYDVKKIIEALAAFNGHVIIQTMFLCGTFDGESVDNTGDEFVAPWLDAMSVIRPQMVMIYTIDRETPCTTLRKASPQRLDEIKAKVMALGIPCSASY